jgi:predicted MFS family arabinose efflux permease
VQVPVKLMNAARPSVSPVVLATIGSSTAIFTATPFLLRPIADEFGVSVGAAGLISTGQLAGFVLGSWGAGRFLRPVRWLFVALALIGVAANLASALAPSLEVLAIARVGSGVSLGLAAWFAWQDAFGDADKTGDVAVVGPLIGVVLPPLITLLVSGVGYRTLFVVMALVAATPLLFTRSVPRVDRLRPHRTRHAATRGAQAMLVALTLVTLGGSSVFVYAAAIGTDLNGLSPLVVSLCFSANALVAIPAAKWKGSRGAAGMWFGFTAILALLMPSVHVAGVFVACIVTWGICFFMGIPAAFALLASRSRFAQERAGDAQAVMALGRVFGPIVGGSLFAAGRTTMMGIAAATIMGAAAALMLYVDRDRFATAPAR